MFIDIFDENQDNNMNQIFLNFFIYLVYKTVSGSKNDNADQTAHVLSYPMFAFVGGEPCLRRSGTDIIPKARMKTLKMTIIIVASFVVCWTPYYLLGIWYWFQPQMLKLMPEYVHHALFVFGNLNTCCDPVIYGFFTPSFRADIASCFCRRNHNSSPKSLDRLSARRGGPSGEAESDLGSGDQPSGQQA